MKLVNPEHIQAWSEEVKKFINTNLDLETANKLLYDACIKSFSDNKKDGIEAYQMIVGLTLDLLYRHKEWIGFDRTGLKLLCEFLKFNGFIIPNHYHYDNRFLYDILQENKNIDSDLFPTLRIINNNLCIYTSIKYKSIEITIFVEDTNFNITFVSYTKKDIDPDSYNIIIELQKKNNIIKYYQQYGEIDYITFYNIKNEYFTNKVLEEFYIKLDNITRNI